MRDWVKLSLNVLALLVLFWPGVEHHWKTSHDPYFVPADAGQYIPAFFKYDPVDPVPTTYAKEYYLHAVCPVLYRWVTRMGAQFGDVRDFQIGLMYVAYAVFVGVMGRLGWVLGGAPLSFAVAALTLTAWIFIGYGFTGGAPRMYGYPLMSLVIYAMIRDRPMLLGIVTVLGGLLYPIVAVIGGLCLAGWMLLKPLSGGGKTAQWRFTRRLAIVSLTAFLTFAALTPLLLGSAPYGRRVTAADIATYPEAGPDGNYRPYDQLPYKLFGGESLVYYLGPLYAHGDPIAPWFNVHKNFAPAAVLFVLAMTGLVIFLVILSGLKSILTEDRGGGCRLISFFAACGVLHVIAWLGAPYMYIPTRYLMFSLPFLITFVFPWSLHALLKRVPRLRASQELHAVVFLGIIGLYLVAFGGRGNVAFAEYAPDKTSRRLFDTVAALPKNVVIAGWPVGPLRKLEYITRRNAFLTGDLHQVLHLDFLLAMRARMDALFDAYLSTDAAPLHRLKQEFGATHLIVETRDFTDAKHAPEYFAPWRARIQPRLDKIKGREYLLSGTLLEQAAVFNQGGLILLDLAKLPQSK